MSGLPGKIGPYQILRKLGAGGMGEVFLAYDERLDRQVAIKRIRSDKDASSESQERFRREARLAAKLNHPAIVHVYDVLTEAEANFIVMEYVEGTNLRRLLDDGPLSVEEAAAIGGDVAEGLSEAHRQGIVHRDLKSENVLATPSGHAKITDFGIAKRLLRGEDEESLTAQGRTLGTYRAMSPEQARGEEVDHRSDLFSLGVLLYEALTGKSPFEAENELAMVHRIVHDRQVPVRKVNPEVPENLSYLIDHLLEKDPRLRPRNAGEVAQVLRGLASSYKQDGGTATVAGACPLVNPATEKTSSKGWTAEILGARSRRQTLMWLGLLVIVGLVSVSYLALRSRPKAPVYVAVPSPEIVKGASDQVNLLAAGIRSALVRRLASLERISPKDAEELKGLSGSPIQLARAVAADEILRSRLDCRLETCRVSLDRIRATDGSLAWSESFDVPTDDLYLVSSAVANQVQRAYPEHSPRPGVAEMEVNGADLAAFLHLRRSFDAREFQSPETLLRELAAIRGRSPRFVDAYLLAADVLRRRFALSRNPADLEEAFRLIEQSRRLAPGDPQPLFLLFSTALASHRLDEAESALKELERLAPGDARVVERSAELLDARGRPTEALAVLRAAVRNQPSWRRLYKLAFMEYQQGDIPSARAHLDQLLARSPDNFDGLTLLAQIELANGDPSRAVELYKKLVKRSPGIAELSNLGLAYFLLGRYPEAAGVFQRTVDQEPRNALLALNLADSYLLMGRETQGQDLYRRVLQLIEEDPSSSNNPQFLTTKAQALAHLNQGTEAVAAVQEALRLAPNNSQVSYEASLVYALLGERNSALTNAREALKLGCEPRWFSFPWFESLRHQPDFQKLLRERNALAQADPQL